MADSPAVTAARAAMTEQLKDQEESRKVYHERMKGKPTPSQEELNLGKMGVGTPQKRDDGSGPEPRLYAARSMTAGGGGAAGTYTTRRATPAAAPTRSHEGGGAA